MKEKIQSRFDKFYAGLTHAAQARIDAFWAGFDCHCLLGKWEKQRLREDFEAAILYYLDNGVALEQALERVAPERLGGFYARPAVLWFALDDAAKIYPLSMKQNRMAVFRLSVYLRQPVVPILLQMALTFTIKRFPSFATTLKKGFFWHYLDTAKRRYCVEEEHEIPCRPLKISHSGSQSFRVLYYRNRISVEFFHVLTDGTGGMVFLKTLAAEYLRLTGVQAEADDTLWDSDDLPLPAEYANEFARVPHSEKTSGFVDKPAVQMSGQLAKQKPCRILHFKMDAAALKAAAARYHGTVTVYLLALMFLSGRAATDETTGEASIQVPVNMRKFYPSPTVRNFALYCGIRQPLSMESDIPALVENITQQMAEKASQAAMGEMLAATEQLVGMLKYVPLEIKQPVASLVYGFLGDKIFSNTLSNLGVVSLPPAYAAEIESMDFVLGPEISNRASCAMVTFADMATFSITKMTVDPSFEEMMYRLLQADGVQVRVEGSAFYGD